MDEILRFLKDNPTYYLATVDEQGNPQVRPFGTIAKVGEALYIQTGAKKDCYRQIVAHPRISLCTFSPTSGEWLRLTADVEPDASIATNDAILDEYPSLRDTYTPGDGNCVALRLVNVTATISSFAAGERTYTF